MVRQISRSPTWFIYDLISQRGSKITGKTHIQYLVYIGQSKGLMPHYFYYPSQGTLVESEALVYTLEELLGPTTLHNNRGPTLASEERTTKPTEELKPLVRLVDQVPPISLKWLGTYLMARQTAIELCHAKGRGINKRAKSILAWPDKWIELAKQIEKRVA